MKTVVVLAIAAVVSAFLFYYFYDHIVATFHTFDPMHVKAALLLFVGGLFGAAVVSLIASHGGKYAQYVTEIKYT